MRAIIFMLLMATSATAGTLDVFSYLAGNPSNWHYDPTEPHAKYNSVTGNVSIHNIPAHADAMELYLPTIAWAVDVSQTPGVTSYNRTVRPISTAGYHDRAWWDSPHGFPETLDLGPILKPNQTIFEWSYLGTMPPRLVPVGRSDTWVTVTVPELEAFWLAVLAFIVLVTASRIWRMA